LFTRCRDENTVYLYSITIGRQKREGGVALLPCGNHTPGTNMPSYMVMAATGRFSAAQKSAVAQSITKVHNQVTGAQTFFAQVIFQDIAPGNHFVGGALLQTDQVFVYGHIRAGRSAEIKKQLLLQLVDAVTAAASIARNKVWVYVTDLPSGQMAEYGHVLPEPGSEAQWLAGLPEEDRELMEKTAS
jgi:phenylpyruvate tautomerase PptA (4-oxalocrotonate tautomerase family)